VAQDFVDPLEHINPVHGVQPREGSPGRRGAPTHRGMVAGTVIAVHRRTTQHAEPHRLDASVGAMEHSEVVVQVDEGDVSELMGKRVAIHFARD
jgi:hypothetical protein